MENDLPASNPTPSTTGPAADRPPRGDQPPSREGQGRRPPRARRPAAGGGADDRVSGSPDTGREPAAGNASDWSPGPRRGDQKAGDQPREATSGGRRQREPRAEGSSRERPPRERGGSRGEGGRSRDRQGAGDHRRGATPQPPARTEPKPATATAASKSSTTPAPQATVPRTGEERAYLAGPLLTAVSRSFAISIKLLPEPLRGPISLGYLFARALDTIADSPAAPVPDRLGHLRAVLEMLKYGVDPAALRTLDRALAPRQTHPGERELLGKLPALFAWMDSLPDIDRWDLQRTLARIGYGQELDLRRFGGVEGSGNAAPVSLETAEETQDYAYLVAGSAGEFWTRLCDRHLPDYSKLPAAEMLKLGRQLGQGLQLVNILRDLPRDLAAGRCYLPAADLAAHGLTVAGLLKTPARARPLLARWRAAAVEHLDAGWRYVQAVQPSKLRYAVALPALLAVRTLALLAKTSPLETPEPVKVPRMAVRQLMLTSAAASILAPRLLDRLYRGPRKAALEG